MRHLIGLLLGILVSLGCLALGFLSGLYSKHATTLRNKLLESWPVKRRVVRIMHWPLVWRYAVQLGQTQPHNETGICLLCHATNRLARDEHQAKDSVDAVVVCGRCGLPRNKWGKRCHGAPKRKFTAIQRQRLVAKQLFWE